MNISAISFCWKAFRLIFVLFSLYIMGDAFYRWDGFSYYASFSEFLPSVALVFILWSIVALITTILICVPLVLFKWVCKRMGWENKAEDLLILLCCFVSIATIAWIGKRLLFGSGSTLQEKLAVLLCVIFATVFLTWILRGKLNLILERITPLVWLFGIAVIFSVPLVSYQTSIRDSDQVPRQSLQVSVADRSQPNIILVTFDALTARDMSLYGYKLETTPFIKKWARKSSVFTNVKAEDGHTTSATASLMTGQRVWTHQTYHLRSKISRSNHENIALELKNNGYYTGAYVENVNASPEGLNIFESFNDYKSFVPKEQHLLSKFRSLLFHLFYGKIKLYDWILLEDFYPRTFFEKYIYYSVYYPFYKKNFEKSKKALQKETFTVLDNFILDVDNNRLPEPFFVWLHLMPPHEPYLPPEPFMGVFDSSSKLRTFYEQKQFQYRLNEHRKRYGQFAREDFKLLNTYRSRYDENILYCDAEFGDFIHQLRERNQLNKTIVILSSDHGESFEHNYYGHGANLYEQVMHIPLIIKYPNQSKMQIIDDLVEQIDIPATILDVANISLPSWMEGRSLVPLMHNKKLSPRPAFSMHLINNRSGHEIEKGIIAVWDGDYKFIHYLEEKKSLFFNLKQDPEELNNLFKKDHEKVQYLLSLIYGNLKKANERIRKGK